MTCTDPDFWRKVLPDLVTPDTMLKRLASEDLADEEDEDQRQDLVEKFMRDLTQMMDGMLDLHRRGQLPDRENAICQKLLLRISLKDDVFDESNRARATEWLSMVEGGRRRRVEIIPKKVKQPRKGRGKAKSKDTEGSDGDDVPADDNSEAGQGVSPSTLLPISYSTISIKYNPFMLVLFR